MRQRKEERGCSGESVCEGVVVAVVESFFAGGRGMVRGEAAIAREAASGVSKIATV